MNNALHYKGYQAKVVFDSDSLVLHGKIEGIKDLITFESNNITSLEDAFHEAVDDYILFCSEVGKEPDL